MSLYSLYRYATASRCLLLKRLIGIPLCGPFVVALRDYAGCE